VQPPVDAEEALRPANVAPCSIVRGFRRRGGRRGGAAAVRHGRGAGGRGGRAGGATGAQPSEEVGRLVGPHVCKRTRLRGSALSLRGRVADSTRGAQRAPRRGRGGSAARRRGAGLGAISHAAGGAPQPGGAPRGLEA
jgi:hypothetical protein